MTKEELVALLREARKDVDAMGRSHLCDRIDAALAAHEAVPPSKVKWRRPCYGSHIYDDGIVKHKVELWGSQWRWFVAIDYRADGFSPTLDEAQRAALAAAKGMK